MPKLETLPQQLSSMKKIPSELSFEGDTTLLEKTLISIVGTRRPSKYTRAVTEDLARKLSQAGVCVVSGGAMGVDAIAHKAAGEANTIAVLPCGIEKRYPAVNKNLLNTIGENGLLLSQFEDAFSATPWSFVVRNEVVVVLGEVLIVAEADLGSGSMRSVEFALEMGKEIYVLPHRLGESEATNQLVAEGKAKVIYDIDVFVAQFGMYDTTHAKSEDEFLAFCKANGSYEECLKTYPQRLFEAELNGEVEVKNGRVRVLT